MKTIKKNKKTYFPSHVDGYNRLKLILKILFIKNKHAKDFKYIGCRDMKGIRGILVSGLGSQGIREFDKFYGINDIKELIRDDRLR